MNSEVTCDSADSRCLDLEFASDNPAICPDSPIIVGLRVGPSNGSVEVSSQFPFRAYLKFSDGREKEVTEKAEWVTTDSTIASVTAGVCTGINVGTVAVEASYHGLAANSQLNVISLCLQAGMDIVLLIDRSSSMLATGVDGKTRMEGTVAAAKAFVDNCIFDGAKDQVAVISFAGISERTKDDVITRRSSVTQHLVLSSSKPDVMAALDQVNVTSPCDYDLPDGGHGSACATGIGGGLKSAQDEFLSTRVRSDTRKLVVLVTDGIENICVPDPITVSTAIKAQNWVIAVIALAVPDQTISVCGGADTTSLAYLASLASCDLFFSVQTTDDLVAAFANVPSTICQNQGDPCFYYIPPAENPQGGPTRDQYDYTGFINWDVIAGWVDLIGIDLWPDIGGPNQGLRVDMVGTDVDKTLAGYSGAAGMIRSKKIFNLAGRYRLSFKLAGNNRQHRVGDAIEVKVGTAFEKVIYVPDWKQQFKTYSYDFSVAGAVAAQIQFKHLDIPAGGIWTVGILLDDVLLQNLDTGEILLFDDFNSENPP